MYMVLGRMGGLCKSVSGWMKVMDMKLLPILFYGCHLWECENSGVAWLINSAFSKGVLVRRGLGLEKFDDRVLEVVFRRHQSDLKR